MNIGAYNGNVGADPATQVATQQQAPQTTNTAAPTLGMFDFLQLLTVQLTTQDPMNPMEDTDFIAQMAQFSSLQEMSRMNEQITRLHSQNEWTTAQQIIGKKVEFTDEDGTEHHGIVEGIRRDGAEISFLVGNAYIPAKSVHSVFPVDDKTSQNTPNE